MDCRSAQRVELLQVPLIGTIARFKLFLAHIQLITHDAFHGFEHVQPFTIAPVQETDAPLHQVFHCAGHLIATDILHFWVERFTCFLRVFRRKCFNCFSANLVGVEAVALVESAKIFNCVLFFYRRSSLPSAFKVPGDAVYVFVRV